MRPDEASTRQQARYLQLVIDMVVKAKMDLPTARVLARARAQAQREAEIAAEEAETAAQMAQLRPIRDSFAPSEGARKGS